jgi:hypothetical protein
MGHELSTVFLVGGAMLLISLVSFGCVAIMLNRLIDAKMDEHLERQERMQKQLSKDRRDLHEACLLLTYGAEEEARKLLQENGRFSWTIKADV